ncbi:hypothetical protein AB0395_17825 [Streptosporangium sp. NPDC051023]|uniref:hypothetical protein n=1 Tax=Streptosporangium sp. NPDC051023 TaxID=3155410 RepID=UPI003450BA76
MSAMTDAPDVAAGWSLLGLPPLPATDGLDRHSAELDGAGAYQDRLVSDGGRVHRLADVNQGQAADAVHAYTVGREGILPQAADLGNRVTVTSSLLRVAKEVVGWFGDHLAEIAVVAGAVVVTAPELLPRLRSMAGRLFAMLRKVMEHIGNVFKRLSAIYQKKRENDVAVVLHRKWIEDFRLKKGPNATRPKSITKEVDAAWRKKHGDEIDISRAEYHELPPSLQAENGASARVALDIVDDAMKRGVDLKSEKFMEDAASKVHDKWLERNPWAPDHQKLPYGQLSAIEQEKDRVVVRAALDHWSVRLAERTRGARDALRMT